MPLRVISASRAAACTTETRVPALATTSAMSTSECHCSSTSAGARRSGAGRKLICATCTADAILKPLDLRRAQAHQAVGQFQFPRSVVPAVAITPAGHGAQATLGPGRRTQVLHGGIAAAQHG